MKKLTNFEIFEGDLPAISTIKEFLIEGDIGSEFIVNIIQKSNSSSVLDKFYNWLDKSFDSSFSQENNLNVTMSSTLYKQSIVFPSVSADTTYHLILIAPEGKGTEIEFSLSKSSYRTDINQLANTTLTFGLKATVTDQYDTTYFGTDFDITSTGSPAVLNDNLVSLNFDAYTGTSDSTAFGLRLIRQPVDSDFIFIPGNIQTDGAVTSSTTVKLDSVTDLVVGTVISSVGSGSLSGTPTITNIDTETKIITMSSAQTFADGVTLAFKAIGSDVISRTIGADVDFSLFKLNTVSAVEDELVKKVRTTASGTTVAVDNTRGISGGGHVTVSGVNFVNTSANTVQSVNADFNGGDNDGTITMQVAQNILINSTIRFKGSTERININNKVNIKKYPTTDRKILLLLDNFITPGAAS